MRQGLDVSAGMWISVEPSLYSLLRRLESLSLEPAFAMERDGALAMFLQPYAGPQSSRPLSPLPEEVALAELSVYADYLPRGGQLSLIEQVRDLIEVHVPQEERDWLDPLRHSAMDVLEVTDVRESGSVTELAVLSLGDQRTLQLAPAELARPVQVGQVLVTRVVSRDDRQILCGTAIVLAKGVAASVMAAVNESRREMEALAGSFELGEWAEFAKRYGHVLMWQVAQSRLSRLIEGETMTRYESSSGEAFLPAVAIYEHHEFASLAGELGSGGTWHGVESREGAQGQEETARTWVQRGDASRHAPDRVVARLTLTPSQLWVECATADRLEAIKHDLASTFGFSLHFRGETFMAPSHRLVEPDLSKDLSENRLITVSPEEEQRLWSTFLEEVYLDWPDKPSPALGGKTPRHAAASADTRPKVADLIHRIEKFDLARQRTGRAGYEYDKLRTHVGV